jgi:hypothetical protein
MQDVKGAGKWQHHIVVYDQQDMLDFHKAF